MWGRWGGGAGLSGALVERQRETDAIGRAIASARSGSGQAVVVRGPPGIGKTDLLRLAWAAADDAGLTILAATGDELETAFAFGAVLQLFEPHFDRLEPAAAEALVTDTGPVGALLVGDQIDEAADHDVIRGLTRVIQRIAAAGPVAILADDVQWWDHPSARFLAYLGRRIDRLPVTVVVAARSGPTPNDDIVARLAASASVSLDLQPLSIEGVGTVVADRFDDAPTELGEACWQASGGNPFLLAELLAGLPPDPTHAVSAAASMTPAGVLTDVAGRLRGLPTSCRDVSSAIAVLGDDAYPRLIARVAGLTPVEAERYVHHLVETHLVVDERPVRFLHPLVRSAAYDAIDPGARPSLHEQAARTLLDDGVPEERVAHHLLEAPRTGATWVVDALREAARRVRAAGAPADAARYLRRALDEPADDHGQVLLELGAATCSYDPEEGIRRLREAAVAFGESRAECGTVHELIGRAMFGAGRLEEARAAFDHSLTHGSTDATALRREVGWVLAARSDVTTRQLARRRLAQLSKQATSATVAVSRPVLAELAYEEALAGRSARETSDLALRALGGPSFDRVGELPLASRFAVVFALQTSGALDVAERVVDLLEEEAHEVGYRTDIALAHHLAAQVAFRRGRLADALTQVTRARSVANEVRTLFTPGMHGLQAVCLVELDRVEEARRVLALPGGDAQWQDSTPYHYHLYAQAIVALAEGDHEVALSCAERCGEYSEAIGTWNPGVVDWREPMALALAALGDRRTARDIAEKNVALTRRFEAPRHIARALVTLAEVSSGRSQLLEEAAQLARIAGDDLTLAHALGALARTASAPGAASAREEAHAVATRIGAERVLRSLRSTEAEAVPAVPDHFIVNLIRSFSVHRDGAPTKGPPAAARLVKLLALGHVPLSVDDVVEELWPDELPDRGRARLRNLLVRARQSYGDLVIRDHDRLRLAPGTDVDLWRFERAARGAFDARRDGDPDQETMALDAVALMDGELLPEDIYAPWAAATRERVRAELVDLLDLLADAAASRDDHEAAAALIERAAQLGEFDDVRLDRAAELYDAGGRSASARELRARARRIRSELGVE